jgi:hypothetical protein
MTHSARVRPSRFSGLVRRYGALPARQQGAVSLLVVLVLLMALTMIVLAMGQVGVKEQIISGNDQRTRKVYDAAEAGLEYGMGWLAANYSNATAASVNDWFYDGTPSPSISTVFAASATSPGILPLWNDVTPGGGEQYDVRVVIDDDRINPGSLPDYIRVTSYARDHNDQSVNTTVEQFGAKTSNGGNQYNGSPPLVMKGCWNSKPAGTAEIYPSTSGSNPYDGQSILAGDNSKTCDDCTAALGTGNCDPSLPYTTPPTPGGPGSGWDPLGMCTCPTTSDTHLDVNEGGVIGEGDTEAIDTSDPNSTAAWDVLFPGMTREFFKDQAALDRDAMLDPSGGISITQRKYIYMDSSDPRADNPDDWDFNNNSWSMELGKGNENDIGTIHQIHSPCGTIEPRRLTKPVIRYFGNGGSNSSVCPRINSNVTIWGVVYYENCTDDGNGWGGGTIFGTLAIESDTEKINSNTALCGVENGVDGSADNGWISRFVRVPGTWRQY